jgi:aerobic carbon-monoxide dehydrogenase medium subunit
MKPVAFDYKRPRSVDAALDLLAARPDAKVLAGGQTLGPMLNLRLVQPALLIDITRIPELVAVSEAGEGIAIGACVTHAAIEDGRVEDPANGYLRRVASGIAYRAVRTRGTIGGSLAHADPAADWPSALLALAAEVEIATEDKRRRVALRDFLRGAMETDLGPVEVLVGVHVPRSGKHTRHGYYAVRRKTGEFAEAIAAVTLDQDAGLFRMVAGGGSEKPVLFEEPKLLFKDGDPFGPESFDMDMAMAAMRTAGMEADAYDLRIRAVAMSRALQDATAP